MAGLVSVAPARRARKWQWLGGTGGCGILSASLYGYQVIGLDTRGSPSDCVRELLGSDMVKCIRECPGLETCTGYVVGSSSIVSVCGDYVVKLYLVTPASNWEAEILSMISGTSLAPVPAARLYLGNRLIGLIEEMIEGEPLAEQAMREALAYLRGGDRVHVLSMAAKLLAQLHKLLRRTGRMCRLELLPRLKWYLAHLPPSISGEIRHVLPEATLVDNTSVTLTWCQLVHQDPHLYQFIATPNGLRLIDFSGEPFRAPFAEAFEPAMRDLAVLLRSASYIAVEAVERETGKPIRLLDKGDPVYERAAEWLWSTTLEAIETYLAHAGLEDPIVELALLSVLIVERAVYEAWYEHLYRTGLLSRVVASLNDPRLLPGIGWVLRK